MDLDFGIRRVSRVVNSDGLAGLQEKAQLNKGKGIVSEKGPK